MQNINLNAGGLIGAVVCGGIALVAVFSNSSLMSQTSLASKIVVVAFIAGAFAGNFIWGLVFRR
jgi:hypothetical protein